MAAGPAPAMGQYGRGKECTCNCTCSCACGCCLKNKVPALAVLKRHTIENFRGCLGFGESERNVLTGVNFESESISKVQNGRRARSKSERGTYKVKSSFSGVSRGPSIGSLPAEADAISSRTGEMIVGGSSQKNNALEFAVQFANDWKPLEEEEDAEQHADAEEVMKERSRFLTRMNTSEGRTAKIDFPKSAANEWNTDYYFSSYGHVGIHEEMLKDGVRTGAYQRAIMDNKHLFKGKIVLDVGSGTGILSFFAAKAGAEHVYGIECSKIVEVARQISTLNGFADRITFIRGKAEFVELPVTQVDIILSEWMGYFLLYESMLDTVIFCRDKWLKKGGLIFPDKAILYVAAIEDCEYKEEKIGYWDYVYGFDYGCVRKFVMEEPIVDTVDAKAVATTSASVLALDLKTCAIEDLNFCSMFRLQLKRKDFLHAFIAWFDVTFSACHTPITIATGPYGRYTHWKQTVFYLDDVLVANDGEVVNGLIAVRKNRLNPRDLDIKIMYDFKGAIHSAKNTQYYRLR